MSKVPFSNRREFIKHSLAATAALSLPLEMLSAENSV